MAVILDYLEVHKTATSAELRRRLEENDFSCSERTLERLKEEMKDSFGLELVYEDKAYRLQVNPNPAQDWLYKMIEAVREVDFYQRAIEDHRFQERILYEETVKPALYNNLAPIFEAIIKSSRIEFTYHFFDSDRYVPMTIEPYLLKKYQQRWYVIGYSDYSKGIRSYGLDRISELNILNDRFTFADYKSIIENYNSIVGLNYSNEPVRMVLRAFDEQRRYLAEVPLHHSQKPIASEDNWTDYEYIVRPNFELMQQLMRIADQSVIMEPEDMRSELSEKLRAALKKYE